jgi:hypothetical protein
MSQVFSRIKHELEILYILKIVVYRSIDYIVYYKIYGKYKI